MKNINTLQRKIMLRVYYVYGLRLLLAPLTLHLAVLVAAVYAVGHFVHVAAVLRNLSGVPVGEIAPWLMRTLTHTEGITLLVLGAAILALLSLPIQLPQYRATTARNTQMV